MGKPGGPIAAIARSDCCRALQSAPKPSHHVPMTLPTDVNDVDAEFGASPLGKARGDARPAAAAAQVGFYAAPGLCDPI